MILITEENRVLVCIKEIAKRHPGEHTLRWEGEVQVPLGKNGTDRPFLVKMLSAAVGQWRHRRFVT